MGQTHRDPVEDVPGAGLAPGGEGGRRLRLTRQGDQEEYQERGDRKRGAGLERGR